MKTKAIITSCSNKFFPSVINLLTSIKVNYPNHPPIYVYDLGLSPFFRFELSKIENLTVIKMPPFCPHWRSCYTWKTYIFAHPPADLNFYIDAGCQVLKPLDEDFEIIEREGMLLIDISMKFTDLVPVEYRSITDLNDSANNAETFSAGIIGFANRPEINAMFRKVYDAAYIGMALGFSPNNKWRNKNKDKNIFIRSSLHFRHDQTLVNLFLRKNLGNSIPVQSHDNYHGGGKNIVPTQRIWHNRLAWVFLEYTDIALLHKKKHFVFTLNRIAIFSISIIKFVKLSIKNQFGFLK